MLQQMVNASHLILKFLQEYAFRHTVMLLYILINVLWNLITQMVNFESCLPNPSTYFCANALKYYIRVHNVNVDTNEYPNYHHK